MIIDGRPVHQMSRGEMAKTIAYVAQKNEMSHATVFDCVLLGRKPYMKWAVSGEDVAIWWFDGGLRHMGMTDAKAARLAAAARAGNGHALVTFNSGLLT